MAAEFARALQGEADGMDQTCDPLAIYQDVDKLRQVIARTDDEAGSYFRFGDDFSQLSEDDVDPELSDEEEEGEGEDGIGVEEEGASNTVRLLKKCLHQNRRFQEIVRVRLDLVTVHLKDIKEKMENLESLKSNAETTSRVKNSLCLSSFLNTPYFVDDRGSTPPPNVDMKVNLCSDSFLTYHKLKNYRLFTNREKPLRMNKDREVLRHTVVKMCLEQLMVPLIERETESSDRREKESIRQQTAEMERLTPQEVVQRASIDEVNWDRVSMVAFGGDRLGSECCQLWHSAASPLLNLGKWDKMEDKRLLELARVHGNRDWEKIAAELQTSRSPIQCLLRYQTFLNLEVHKGFWSYEEDQQLAELVDRFGAKNWALIASELGGHTANQCLQRWTRGVSDAFATVRKGKWTDEENELLERAVSVHGQQWVKVASMVKTRNDRQCRERWVNVLSPEVNRMDWLEEEERKLCLLCKKHQSAGAIKWSAVAKELPGRTDAQCRRHYLYFQTHPTEAVKYVCRNKKQLLIKQRHRGMGQKAQDRLSGQITELAGEDIEDDLMPDSKQAELQRFMDRTLLPPACVPEHSPLLSPDQLQPSVADSVAVGITLPPYNVDSGRYGPSGLLALQFSSPHPRPAAPGQGEVTTEVAAPRPDTLQSGRRRRRRRKKVTVSSPLSQVRMQTFVMYQEYPPVRSPPQPYCPLMQTFNPEFSPLHGTLIAPRDTPTPCFAPPALMQQAARPRPVHTQFYTAVDPTSPSSSSHQPLTPHQPPPQPRARSTPSTSTGALSELPTATPLDREHHRSTSFFSATTKTQARLLNMATAYSPALGGFVPMPHIGDTHCFYSPYSVAMPPPVSTPQCQQPHVEPSMRVQVVDTRMNKQVDALRDTARSMELGTDHILAEVAPIFGLSFDPSRVDQVEQESDRVQPTSLSPPTPQPPEVACEGTPMLAERGGMGKGVSGPRRRSALPSPEASSPKRARRDGPLSRQPQQTQPEDCGTAHSSAARDVPSCTAVAREEQTSSPDAMVSGLVRKRTRSGPADQLPTAVQCDDCTEKSTSTVGTSAANGGVSTRSEGPSRGRPTASGGPCASGKVQEIEDEVDIVAALRRCSFPSTQFSTLLQAMKVSTPLQAGGTLTRPPQTAPHLPPNKVTMDTFKRLTDYIDVNRERLCETSRSKEEAASEDRSQLLLQQRFNSLFAWPALTAVLGEQADTTT